MWNKKIIIIAAVFLFFLGSFRTAFLQADQSPVDVFLCEYAIQRYKQGDLQDAISQLKKALMVNPNNSSARDLLRKILKEKYDLDNPKAGSPPKKTKTQIMQEQLAKLMEEVQVYKKQFKNLKSSAIAKDMAMQQLTQEVQKEKSRLKENEQKFQLMSQKKEEELEQAKKEMAEIQNKISSQQKLLESARKESSEKVQMLSDLSGKLRSGEYQYKEELLEKEKELNKLKSDFDAQLKIANEEITAREDNIKELKEAKESIQEENRIAGDRELAKIDLIVKGIEKDFPEVATGKSGEKAVMRQSGAVENKESIARIENLMRGIEEVLPLQNPDDPSIERIDKLMEDIRGVLPEVKNLAK